MKITPNVTWQEYKEIRIFSIETNPEAFANTLDDVVSDVDEKWQKYLESSNKRDGSVIFFARDDNGSIVGIVGAFWGSKIKNKHIANIFGTFVKPETRGLGVGSMLMEELIKELKMIPQLKKAKLEVVSTEIPAIGLYKKFGFKAVGLEKADLYQPHKDVYDDVYLMELPL